MSVVYHNIVKKTTQILHKTPARIYVIFAGLRKNLLHRLPIYIKPQRLHVVGAAAQRNAAGNDDDLWLCADGCTHHSDRLSISLSNFYEFYEYYNTNYITFILHCKSLIFTMAQI